MANDLNATGTWTGGNSDISLEFQLVQNGAAITGTMTWTFRSTRSSMEVSGTASGTNVKFSSNGSGYFNSRFEFDGTYDPAPNTLLDKRHNQSLRRS